MNVSNFSPFDPLKAKSLADTEVAALAQKREIKPERTRVRRNRSRIDKRIPGSKKKPQKKTIARVGVPATMVCCFIRNSFFKIYMTIYTPPKIEKPPSTHIIAPVTNCEASLNSQINAPFNSLGWPKRLKGVCFITSSPLSV